MSEKEARYTLEKHTILLNLVMNGATFDASEQQVLEVFEALKYFEPEYHWDRSCGACCTTMLKQANRYRLKFHKFDK